MKIRKNVTKKLVKKINGLTNDLFKQSIIEIMNIPDVTDEQVTDFMSKVRRAGFKYALFTDDEDETKDLLDKKEKIDTLYLEKMICLTTQDLHDILFLHEHEKPPRAQRTLETIYSELTRRSLFNDSSQSDAIYKNGDLDVKSKSRPSRKNATSKRCKTNKN